MTVESPQEPSGEELARRDLLVLGSVAAATHPNSPGVAADELARMLRPDLDYGIGESKSTEDIAFAGAMVYVHNRLDDAQKGDNLVDGSSIAADILSFIAQLDEYSCLRRGKTIRVIRNELEQRSLRRYLTFEAKIANDAIAVLNQELSHRNREAALLAGTTAVVAGFAFRWLLKQR